ncbi:30S ribosomal protein S15 [Candidatus Pacearchaeota archaeon]|nr:30S ribosomal protein S15 [Candidatus Pacearchaeota archaeon]
MTDEKKEEIKTEKPDWLKIKPAELDKIILGLHNEGNSPAKIGLILRDKYGIPKAKLLGKKISTMIKSHNLIPVSEKSIFLKKVEALGKHIAKNKHDHTSKRSLSKTLWKVKKLEKSI